MGVGVDEARCDVHAGAIDRVINSHAWVAALSDGVDFAVADHDPSVVDDAVICLCPDGGAVDQHGILLWDFAEGVGAEG